MIVLCITSFPLKTTTTKNPALEEWESLWIRFLGNIVGYMVKARGRKISFAGTEACYLDLGHQFPVETHVLKEPQLYWFCWYLNHFRKFCSRNTRVTLIDLATQVVFSPPCQHGLLKNDLVPISFQSLSFWCMWTLLSICLRCKQVNFGGTMATAWPPCLPTF